MSFASALVNETKRLLYGPTREQKNQLAAAVTDTTSTTFSFTHDLNFSEGAVLAVDLELVYVWSVSTSAKTAVVSRGWDGSTPATHLISSIVSINPSFSDFTIFQAINADLADLSSPANGLFRVPTPLELTYNSAIRAYDMTSVTDVLDVLSVRYDDSGPAKLWPEIKDWELKRFSETSDFASGFAIVVHNGRSGGQLRVVYKAPYAPLTALTDDVQTVAGLSLHADDIPPLGAAWRLSTVREVSRNFYEHQGDTRRAEEVPPGSQLRAGSGLAQLRAQRIQAEAARLNQAFPVRRKGR